MSHQAHGTQTLPRLTYYDSSEANNFYHGYRYSPNRPYNSYINSCAGNIFHGGSQQMMGSGGLQYPNCDMYNNYESYWPPFSGNDYLQQSIQGYDLVNRPQVRSSSCISQFGGFQEMHNPNAFGGTFGQDSRRVTYYVSNMHSIVHFSRVPRQGDIFSSQRFDNVLILDFVSTESSQENHTLPSSGYPRDRDLYRIQEDNGKPILQRMGRDIFTFYEENTTATYYLPDKDIVLHFTRVPRDGDIFFAQRNDNVVILETSPGEISQERHNMHSRDRDLYQVHERNGGVVLMKMDNNNMPSEETYFVGGVTQDEDSTFTYYLRDKEMAFHFTKLPTPGVNFRSQKRNNIMILDVFPPENFIERPKLRSYGSPWDTDYYRVQQSDDGFEIVKITHGNDTFTIEDIIRRMIKIRRYIASNMSSAEEDAVCGVCLAAFKDFDRVGSIDCGHEYHVSCIVPLLRQKRVCPICKQRLSIEDAFCGAVRKARANTEI